MPKHIITKTNKKFKKLRFSKASKGKGINCQNWQIGVRHLETATSEKHFRNRIQWTNVFKGIQENNYEQIVILK